MRTAVPADRQLPPGDYPDLSAVTIVTRYVEALEILRSKDMRPSWGMASLWVRLDDQGDPHVVPPPPNAGDLDDSDRSGPVRWDSIVQGHTALLRSHGPAHLKRRRAVNPLFGRRSHLWYRDAIVLPALRRNLSGLLTDADADGRVRTDLLRFAKRLFAELAGSLVGFDGVDTRQGAESMLELHRRMDDTRRRIGEKASVDTTSVDEAAEFERMMGDSLAAKAELKDRFYDPSLRRRQELVARHRAGELTEDALPRDFLTLMALGVAEFSDAANPDGGFIMAFNVMSGATGTNTQTLLHMVDHLERWMAAHPEDRPLEVNVAFLEHALYETLRLRANGTIAIPRLALADVTLSTGRRIRQGEYVAVMSREVNTDPDVFGATAAEFDPRRVVPSGTYPYGLGFGSGAHMCIGQPLVTGEGGITGTIVPTVQALYAAGMRADPAAPPERRADVWPFRQEFGSFPVVFERDHLAAAE